MHLIKRLLIGLAALTPVLAVAPVHAAATTVVVTPSNPLGWSTSDTRPGGSVSFVSDLTSPLPKGALKLTTDATTTSKAQYMHAANVPLSDVSQLGYSAKQNSASFPDGTASYQLAVMLGGTTGFTTFVYEPYENSNVMVNGAWQTYDVDAGQFWSSRTASDGADCNTSAGFGGAPFYTLAELKAACPAAVVVGYGVNIGSNNPSYDINVDAFVFNDTTYDFELDPVMLANKDECKKDGWKTSESPVFKNQGDCVSYFASNGKAKGNPVVLSNNPTF